MAIQCRLFGHMWLKTEIEEGGEYKKTVVHCTRCNETKWEQKA